MQAGIIAAGLAGIERRADPGPRSDANVFVEKPPAAARAVPPSLMEAVRALRADAVLRGALGEEFVEAYAKMRTQAWLESMAVISQHELDTTLDV